MKEVFDKESKDALIKYRIERAFDWNYYIVYLSLSSSR